MKVVFDEEVVVQGCQDMEAYIILQVNNVL